MGAPVEPLKIPLGWPWSNRTSNFQKDALRRNCMLEKAADGVYVVKRPGTSATLQAGNGIGQGAEYYNGAVCHISGDRFNVTATPNNGTTGSAFTLAATGPWNPRSYAASCVFKDRLWVMAGLTAVAAQSSDVWSSTDGATWIANGPAPWKPRRAFSAVVLGSKMYIAGGYDGATYYNDVWSTEDGTDWKQETAAAPWLARSSFTFIAAASGMYVIGGTSALIAAHDDVWFSSDGAEWVRLGGPFGWATRTQAGGCYYQSKLWIFGGQNLAGVLQNDVWSSRDGIVWIQEYAAAFASARLGVGVCVYGNAIWVIGGLTGAGQVADVYRRDPITLAWTLIAAAPGFTARVAPCVQVFRSQTLASTYRWPTIWVYAGGTGFTNDVWYGQLNTAIASSTVIPAITVANEQFVLNAFQTNTRLLLKSPTGMWIFDAGTVTKVSDTGYPAKTVRGLVVLGGFGYVMDESGLIYNCALDNPYYWPALNVLGADYEDDRGMGLVKYKNYVVALGETTTQFFYDAGLQFGSPLQPYLNANSAIGVVCQNGWQKLGDTVYAVIRSAEFGPQVAVMDGAGWKPISNPFIDKILAAQGNFAALRTWVASAGGHSFFGVYTSSATLVFDSTSNEWEVWSTAGSLPLLYSAFAPDLVSGVNYVQDPDTGNLAAFSAAYYQDGAASFLVQIRTDLIDGGNKRRKFWGRLDIVGDRNSSTISVSYSDDDYQTYSTARTVDMSEDRPALFRNGSSLRRAFLIQQEDDQPMRLQRLEQVVEQGQ